MLMCFKFLSDKSKLEVIPGRRARGLTRGSPAAEER